MKKILSFLTILLMLVYSVRVCADEEKTFTVVKNADQFLKAIYSAESIKLAADIDLTTYYQYADISHAIENYGGEITGEKDSYNKDTEAPYYKIKGLYLNYIVKQLKGYNIHNIIFSGCGHYLFEEATNCTFNELFFEDCGVQHVDETESVTSLITASATNCTFTNICFLGCKLYGWDPGLITCYALSCKIDNCFASSTCQIYGKDGDYIYTGTFVGSASRSKISNCKSFALVMAYSDKVGGIVGQVENGTTCTDCQFYGMAKQVKYSNLSSFLALCEKCDTYNTLSEIGSAASTAWTIGWLQKSFINQCAISCIEASTTAEYLAGINFIKSTSIVKRVVISGIGYAITDASLLFNIALAFNYAYFAYGIWAMMYEVAKVAVTASGPDEVGGIAGHAENATFTRCANYGMVYTLDAYGGGIVGYAKSNTKIINCVNNGAVHGGEQTGGIVGYISGGSLHTNMNVGSVSCDDETHAGIICGQSEDDCSWLLNCYSDTISGLDAAKATDYTVKASQQDLISGRAALFLNEKSLAHGDSCPWRQNIGSDFFPNLCASHDTVTADSINTELSATLEIADKWALTSAMVNPYSDISLTSDIDFEGSYAFNLSSEFMPFMGKINGNGHTISNVSFTQTGDSYLIPGTEVWGSDNEDVGLLGCAKNAKFSNLYLKDFSLDFKTNVVNASLFVAKSINCTYDNVNLTGSSTITQSTSDDDLYQSYNIGGLVGYSQNDVFRNCSTGPQCNLTHTAYINNAHPDANLGGIAGRSDNSTFYRCCNRARVYGQGDCIGGIIGMGGGTEHITSCLNAGEVTGEEMSAGIAGWVESPYITYCVNTGTLGEYNNSRQLYRASILGYSATKVDQIKHNLNFGIINYVADPLIDVITTNLKQIAYYAWSYDDDIGEGNIFYCSYNGEHNDNISDATYQKILSGQWVYDMNKSYWDAGNADTLFFQKLEKNYFTSWPVPLPEAGTVYSDILCDGSQGYSNIYNSTAEHTSVASGYGTCSTCGNVLSDIPSSIKISNAEGLTNLAIATNKGIDFSNTTVSLTRDIDMKGYSFIPIGKDMDHAYKGTFDGGGHRVKNIDLTLGTGGSGLFGTISANPAITDDDGLVTGGTEIKNVVVDSTCNISVYATGVAGLIGAISSTSGSEVYFTIRNCGNEANITGGENTGGILGGIYNNNNTAVDIINCYNSGDISGTSVSGAICGYARTNTAFVNCWNSGSVTGYSSGYPFANISESNRGTNLCKTTNCFDVNTQSGVTTISTDSLHLGPFCQALNEYVERKNVGKSSSYTSWAQDIGVNTHPVFGTSGVTYSRTMTNPWGTIVLPFDVTISSKNTYSLYQLAAIKDSTLCLTKMSGTLAAGTPAIIKMNGSAGTYTLSLSAPDNQTYNFSVNNPTVIGGLKLNSTYSSKNISSIDGYTLSDGSFCKTTSSDNENIVYSDPFSAYLVGLLPNNAQTLTFSTNALEDYTSTFTIRTAAELTSLADIVNSGQDYSGTILAMGNDIDMTGVEDFTPVGSNNYPYCGTFDGQGYRIKNLAITGESYTGLFGYVGGYNKSVTANIKNVIIDSSCSNTSTGTGVAGLIGCVTSTSGKTCNVNIENCGNEATIAADRNVGGILGGVFNNDNTIITINNCYNTGAITANSMYATALGYVRKNYTITNCYNSGTLTSTSDTPSLYRTDSSGGTTSVTNCYDITSTQDGVTQITADQVATGELCQTLNSNRGDYSAWTQDLGDEDSHPTFGTAAMHYSRTMANQWGTICLPFAAESGDDYDFYELTGVSDDALVLTKVSTSEAGKPYVIRRNVSVTDIDVAANGTTYVANPVAGSSANGLTLTGAYASTDVTDQDGYIIANNAFWNIAAIKGENKVYCSPFYAWLAGTISSGAKQLTIGFDDDTPTAVETLNAITCGTAEYYDLNGRHLNELQQGINIVKFKNGTTKKVIIK